MSVYTLVALLYLALGLPLMFGVNRLGKRLAEEKRMIRIDAIHKRFQQHAVLKGVSLDVQQGEVVCLIGPSGSGKSTVLRCINGFETYDEGSITIDGVTVDAHSKRIHELRMRVGMVFQRFNLFSHRTALENVMEGRSTCGAHRPRKRASRPARCSTRSPRTG